MHRGLCAIAQLLVFSTVLQLKRACIKKMYVLVWCCEGPLSVLFAYDAVAYYMWKLDDVATNNPADFSKYTDDGEVLGRSARNTECEHGTCFHLTSCLLHIWSTAG